MRHSFAEASSLEDRHAETLIYPERAYVQIFVFSLKSLYKSKHNSF